MTKEQTVKNVIENPMSAEAWQECGKACGWKEVEHDMDLGLACLCKPVGEIVEGSVIHIHQDTTWLGRATVFHTKNLTEGWEKAVEYLTSVTS